MKRLIIGSLTASLVFLAGCNNNAQQHLNDVRSQTGERMTVGKVQRTIRLGMPNAAVVECLGSPNIVSTDEQRREVWVYDKISTETVYSTSGAGGGISSLILGVGHHGFGGGGGLGLSGHKSTGAGSTSQRTLTIIIKFDRQGTVRDIAYHSSQF